MKRLTVILVIFLALAIPGVPPVLGGSLQDIPPGGTVFIGEQGLNLTGIPSGATLSWYTGPRIIGQSAPDATITVGNNASFYVAPSDFAGRTGNWYIGGSTQVGLVVNDPVQTVSVYDQNTQNQTTNEDVSAGDNLTFRVETNMNVIPAQRPGASGFFTIRVRAPDGTVYTRLYQDQTTLLNLTGLAPDAMPWYWVPLEEGSEEGWSTGVQVPEHTRVYPLGRYTIWTESDLNGMKENYKDVSGNDFTGRTVSDTCTVTLVSNTVKIEVSNTSVVRGNTFTVTITGKPKSAYYLWVEDTSSMSGMAGDQPPSIIAAQEGVLMDPKAGPWPIGRYVPSGSDTAIQQDVAQYYGSENVRGTVYYASVTLSGTGTRTVGFSTTKDTKAGKYTISVERPEPYNPPLSDTGTNRTCRNGDVDISVEKGGIDVDHQSRVVIAGTYFLGEEITLSGTNSVTSFTYLFITGPNLPVNGGQMTDPVKPVDPFDPDTFARAEVINKKWEYKWQTASLNLDAGPYTIYAMTNASDRSFLSDSQYNTVPVLLKKPFISALASPSVVASGDTLFIRGIAAGQPEEGVAVWILGKNKVIYQTPGVSSDGTFEQEISQGQTAAMAAGQYFVVVQHPMYNEIFDVWPASSVVGYNNQDLVVGTYPLQGNTLFRLQGEGSLTGPDAADALVQALNNPGVDDIYAKLQFLVEDPAIAILPVSEKQVGDMFNIAGTTNLATDDVILVEVTSSSFHPTMKTQNGEFSGTSGTVKVRKGTDGRNTWSFHVDATAFRPDVYIVQVTGLTVNAQASTRFNVVAFNPATHKAVLPYEESVNEPDTPVIDATPASEITGDGNVTEDSGKISVGAKASHLASVIGSNPATFPATTVTAATVVNATATVPARTSAPANRPTVQPGFGALAALTGLVVAAFIIVRRHR